MLLQAAIPSLGPHELLLLLLGVACTESVPRRSKAASAARAGWLLAAARQLQPHLARLDPQQLSGSLLAFGKLQYQPSRDWLADYKQAWRSQQGKLAAKDHALVLSLDPEFAAFWLRQSRSQLGSMNSQELASCVWALGRLGLQPPEEWLQRHLSCSAQLAGCMSPQQLAMLFHGCARLQYLPDVLVTAELLMSAAEQLPSFTPHSLALLLHALGGLCLKPNKEWMALALEQARYRFIWSEQTMQAQHHYTRIGSGVVPAGSSEDFGGVLLGLYRMRYHPGQRWLDALAQVLALKVHLLPPQRHAQIVAQYSWDCGLACVLMVLRALGCTNCDLPQLRKLSQTTSVWTVDLAHLLARFGVAVTFCTITIGINGDYANEWFYMEHLEDDEQRVRQLFSQAAQLGICLQEGSMPLQELVAAVASGRQLAILLVDRRKIDPWQAAADIAWNYTTGVTSATGYTGHYILLGANWLRALL
ncbi:Guanylylate cyclase-domain-containing protein [Scenedesmus sp. NREL 46B-D3]|nr:Guanylylate cyclase-domain-containing protein [Scenedesmus sp. NREL 46B-D3]